MAEKMVVESVSQLWGDAKKVRSRLHRQIDQAEDPSADERELIKRLETVEDPGLGEFRKYCVMIVWADFTYASEHKVEETLWLTHVKLARAYRKVTDRLSGSQHAVMRNRVNKLHQNFLKISQEFYKGYLQRLAARYHTLPQLQRVLKGAALQGLEVPEAMHVDAAAAKIDKLVTASAYRTLVCLGDLARYRAYLRSEKDRKFDSALAYYSLANDVDSRFGTAHHQIAVLLREEERYLDAVYYLYRSLVSEAPHPQATQNLRVVFTIILKNRATSARNQMAHGALQTWFTRLHAHFEAGKEFSQHNEMEKEVLGRFDKAVEAHDFQEGLLKVLLVNICAYELAAGKVEAKWTEEASRSCQFVLRLHIQMITSISAHVESELTDLLGTLHDAPGQINSTNENGTTSTAIKFSPVTEAALPLLRVCMTWLCMYRTRIVDYQPHLLPYLPDMYRVLSRTLTRFIEFLELLQTQKNDQFKPINYLFFEDTTTLDIKPLHGSDLPPKCQLSVDSMTGEPKPRFDEDSGLVIKEDDITYSRALDIIYRAYVLANDAKFPFALRHGSVVVYLEDGKPTQMADGSSVQVDQPEPMVNTTPLVNTPPTATKPPAVTNKAEVAHRRQDSASAAALIATLGLTRSANGLQMEAKEGSPQQVLPVQRSTPKLQSARATPQQATPQQQLPKDEERRAVPSPAPAGQAPTGRFVRQSVQLGPGPIKPIRQPHNPPTGELKTNFKLHPKHPSNLNATAAKVPSLVPAESFNSADETRVFDMVKDFLEPREAQQQQQMTEEPSYGMHSDTARELFGSDLAVTPVAAPTTAPKSSATQEPVSGPWDTKPTPTSSNGWGSSNLWANMSSNAPQNIGGGMQLNGSQSGWPTTAGFTDRPMTGSSGFINAQYGHAASNSGSFSSPTHNLAPGTHWRQDPRGSAPPAGQPDPWARQTTAQPRQSTPGFNPAQVGPIRSLDDALAAQLAALIPNRSNFSPAASTPQPPPGYNNQLPVPGSFGSSQFAFSQESGRPQVNNSPWNVGSTIPTAGYAYQSGPPSSGIQPPPGFGRPGAGQQAPGSSRPLSQDQSQDGYEYNQYYNQFR